MPKLNQKERSRYDEAEGHLRNHCTSAQCLWELVGNNGSPYCILAGFLVAHSTRPPEMVILAVRRNGTAWEIFGAPQNADIAGTFESLNRMWGR